ncbi:hypothetical protein CBS101457_000327 [Exobasidium rhododendri]|nr:hypothetical protein CBS101457_000327 [Exobasidium rhododendri]
MQDAGSSSQHPHTYSNDFQHTEASHGNPPARKSAIIFTDAKLDDNAALTLMRYSDRYDTILAIINGVSDTPRAHGNMIDFFQNLEHKDRQQSSASVVFIGGQNPLLHAAPHERHFHGRPTNPDYSVYSKELLTALLVNNHADVDIWHLAPAYHQQIEDAVQAVHDANRHVDILHSTIGYNNLQGPEGPHTGPAEKEHVMNLCPMLRTLHPHATPYLVQTKLSFGDSSGGTQAYKWAEKYIPPHHLKVAGELENFHLMQLRQADELLRENNMKQLVHSLPESDEELQRQIWAARYKETNEDKSVARRLILMTRERINILRKHHLTDDTLLNRLQSVLDGFKNECQVELCDANHYITVSNLHHGNPNARAPATVNTEAARPVIKLRERDDEPLHGYTIINHTAKEARKQIEAENIFKPLKKARRGQTSVGRVH